jgi:gluconokinase
MVVIVMGVSGAGKSTIGRRVADALGWEFVEGDAYHPTANIRKLSHAVPLTDEDRDPWLQTLRSLIEDWLRNDKNVILACSALKARHRERLLADPKRMRIVYLKGLPSLLRDRLLRRGKHFMAPELLQSQLDTLEEPPSGKFPPAATIVDIGDPPEVMVDKIREALGL